MKLIDLFEISVDDATMARMRDIMAQSPLAKGIERRDTFVHDPKNIDKEQQNQERAIKVQEIGKQLKNANQLDRTEEIKQNVQTNSIHHNLDRTIYDMLIMAISTYKKETPSKEEGGGQIVGVLRSAEDRLINKAKKDVQEFSRTGYIDRSFWLSPRTSKESIPSIMTLWRHINF